MNFYLKVASGNANLQIGLLKMNLCAIFRYDILSVVKTLNWKIKKMRNWNQNFNKNLKNLLNSHSIYSFFLIFQK